jgi:hypothetical protein
MAILGDLSTNLWGYSVRPETAAFFTTPEIK